MLDARKSCLGDIMEALRVCGMPYLMPTPTRGSALATRLTVVWSGNAKNTDAAGEDVAAAEGGEGKDVRISFASNGYDGGRHAEI